MGLFGKCLCLRAGHGAEREGSRLAECWQIGWALRAWPPAGCVCICVRVCVHVSTPASQNVSISSLVTEEGMCPILVPGRGRGGSWSCTPNRTYWQELLMELFCLKFAYRSGTFSLVVALNSKAACKHLLYTHMLFFSPAWLSARLVAVPAHISFANN